MKPSTVSGTAICISSLLIAAHVHALPFSVVVLDQQWQATTSHEATQPPAPTVSGGYNESQSAPDTVVWFKESRVRALTTNPTTNRTVGAEIRTARELVQFAGFEQFTHRNVLTNPGRLVTADSSLVGTATTISSITVQITTTVPIIVTGSVGANYLNQFDPNPINSPSDTRSATLRIFDGANQVIFERVTSSFGTGQNAFNLAGLVPNLTSGVYRFETIATATWNVTGAVGYVGGAAGSNIVLTPGPGAGGLLLAAGLAASRRRRSRPLAG